MTTQQVTFNVPSNGWTGTVDVTDADLLTDVSTIDFTVFYDGTEQGSAELANWTKSSSTQLTYSGSSLNSGDVVTIRRDTPNEVVQTVSPQTTIQSSLWNAEFDRIIRWREEKDLFGVGTTANAVSDEAYGSGWDGVTNQAASKNSIYDYLQMTLPISVMNGRLTLTSGTPIDVTSVAATSTLYYTPYNGTTVWLYDTSGLRWEPYVLTERSLTLSGMTINFPEDVYLYNNAGTLTLEKVAWTDAITRATSLAYQNGVLVKSGDASRRYVGTILPTSATTVQIDLGSSVTDDKTGRIGYLNHYNKVAGQYYNNANTQETIGTSTVLTNSGLLKLLAGIGKVGIQNNVNLHYTTTYAHSTTNTATGVLITARGDTNTTLISVTGLETGASTSGGISLSMSPATSSSGTLNLSGTLITNTGSMTNTGSALSATFEY